MSVFQNGILGFVNPQDWLDIGFEPTRPNDPIDGLFGDVRTDNIVAYWQSIAAEYNTPMMAQFHGFDTEAQKTFDMPIDVHNVEKGLIKVKKNQSERMRALNRVGVVGDQALYEYVINDGIRLAEQVVTRTKVAKNELMATGKVTIRENNLNLTVDYGVPESQTAFSLDFSKTADIPGQIQSIIDTAAAHGVTLNGLQTSRQNLTKMRQNAAVQTAINGNTGAGALVKNADLEAWLETEYGITRVVVNDLTYGAESDIGADGRPHIRQERYYPQNKMTFFATNANGKVGDGLWGDPPETTVGELSTAMQSGVSPFVYIDQWVENDPKVLWTKASSLFIPVLFDPNSLWIATVDDTPALGTLTVTSAAGTASGDTKLTVSPGKEAAGNVYKYKADASAAPTVTYGQNVRTWTTWDGVSDLTIPTGHKVTVVEADAAYKAQNAGNATATAKT